MTSLVCSQFFLARQISVQIPNISIAFDEHVQTFYDDIDDILKNDVIISDAHQC